MIEVEHITKRFHGNVVLRDATHCFQRNRTTAILGKNGSGKSTLLHVISGAYKPDSGRVLLHNEKAHVDLTQEGPEERRRVGVIRSFQEPRSYGNMTVRNVLTIGMLTRSSGRIFGNGLLKIPEAQFETPIQDALNTVNLFERADTPMKELSFGQRKLLDLAGLILADARVWLLDEPFAGVDSASAQIILSCIQCRKAESSLTIILVAHEQDLVEELSDQTVIMEDGRIVQENQISNQEPHSNSEERLEA
ncbi:MAG: ATP-binding cassette domain-containing protein [Planctomycetota bacterium]